MMGDKKSVCVCMFKQSVTGGSKEHEFFRENKCGKKTYRIIECEGIKLLEHPALRFVLSHVRGGMIDKHHGSTAGN